MNNSIGRRISSIHNLYLSTFYSSCVALLYHRINDLEVDNQLLCVAPDRFHEQVNYLKNNFTLLDIDEFLEIKKKQNKKFPKKAIVLTFDDGYADNYYQAIPVLESFHAQALFYITTEHVDTTNEFWWDELENIVLGSPVPLGLELESGDRKYSFSTGTREEKIKTYHALHPFMKDKKSRERNRILEKLRNWSGQKPAGRESHRILNSSEINKMSRSKSVALGAHTHTHTRLSLLSAEEQLAEIKTSKEILEKITEKPIIHFSYPYGEKKDYNSDAVNTCKSLGFEMVFSNFRSIIYAPLSNFELPRFIVRNWTLHDFKEKLNSFFSQR